MELAMQSISKDQLVRSDSIQDLKEFNSQSLVTRAQKGDQLVAMMPAIIKAFKLMGDNIVDLSTEKDASKNNRGSYDEKWLEESEAKVLKQFDGEKEQI